MRLPALTGLLVMMSTPLQLVSAEETFSVVKDIPYLGEERAEKMDAYLPAASFQRPVPAVLLIHGGGWKIGDKADARERNIGSTFAAHGIAVFSINYLLDQDISAETGKSKRTKKAWPQNVYDCKTALRYLKKEAAQYGIDPQRIGVMGGSAGGHLALLIGTSADVPELNKGGLYTDQDNHVACIIDFYGIPDLRQFGGAHFSGATPAETEANLTLASPITYVAANTPPILIAHGDADKTVNVQISRDFVKLLQEKGATYQYIEIPGAPHTFHLQPKQKDLRPEVMAFLDQYLIKAAK